MAAILHLEASKAPGWEEALEEYLLGCVAVHERKTVQFYSEELGMLARWAAKERVALADFRERHLRRYLAYRATNGGRNGMGVSPKTRKHDWTCARTFFAFCRDQGYTDADNPATLALKPRVPKVYVKMPTEEECAALLDAVEQKWDVKRNPDCRYTAPPRRAFYRYRDTAILSLLIATGCRIGEALALTLEDFQPQHERMLIREAKGDEPRIVPLSPALLRQVRAWMQYRPKWWKGGGLLFCTEKGEPLRVSAFADQFRRYRDFAHQQGYSLHGLRHLAGTLYAEHNPYLCQTVLGHKDLNTTQGYLHLREKWLKEEAGKVDPLKRVNAQRKASMGSKRRA